MESSTRRSLCRRRRGPARALLAALALLLAAALPPACTGPVEKTDCDEQLRRNAYDTVLRDCKNPYDIASAYLGKAGLNLFDLVGSTAPPGDVTGLLGLTAGNIDQKRRYVNLAVQAVANPEGGNQAFALMVATFLGMAVTMEQFLDNGAGATALDGVIDQTEIDAALGLAAAIPSVTVAGAPPSPALYLSVVSDLSGTSNTAPYTIHCLTPACNATGTDDVYDDATGEGVLDTASLPASVSVNEGAVFSDANAGTLASSAYPTQILALTLPLTVSAPALAASQAFTGAGNPGGPFEIGMSAYLEYLALATEELARASGSSGGTEVATQINALMNRLDNGAFCAVTNPLTGPLVAPMNELYALYQSAAGTAAKPASGLPATFPYMNENLLDPALVPGLLGPNLFSPLVPTLPDLTTLSPAFAVKRYKLLFPTAAGLAGFNATKGCGL